MSLIQELVKELGKAAKLADRAERGVSVAAVLAEALRSVGQDPILVGGAAVEFYTKGGYSTADLDMVAEGGVELAEVMRALGFKKMGKDFVHPLLKIYVEFPGRSLGPTERFVELHMGGRILKIIAPEDLMVDRLCAFKFWQSAQDGINALLLFEMVEVDRDRLEERARQEKVFDALRAVLEVSQAVVRKALAPEAANRLLLKKMQNLRHG